MDSIKKIKHVKRSEKNKKEMIRNIGIVFGVIVVIGILVFIATSFFKKDKDERINLIINNNNVTSKMKKEVYVDDADNIYLSKEDVQNYFDRYIEYKEETKLLTTTSDKKVAKMKMEENKANINGTEVEINGSLIKKDGTIYLPFSDLSKRVYNAEITYLKEEKIVLIDSLDREFKKADMSKKVSVKDKAKGLSKTIDKVKKGEKVVVISSNKGWTKIRTQRGIIGYVKDKCVANITTVREEMKDEKQIQGKVNLVWDYYSQVATAPNRKGEKIEGVNVVSPAFFGFKEGGNGQIIDNAKQAGEEYIKWAHENGYKVWPIFSNSSMLKTTSAILNDEEERAKLINVIVSLAERYQVDGINLDFENMKEEDKDIFSQFVIELAPRLRDTGKVLSIDVTAPDGAPNWSLCYDRDVLAHVADYLIFMAYDQNGSTSPKEGTTAGYNWVENNINKFLGQEAVDHDKLILGIPFYTRLWTERNGKVTSKVVYTKDIDRRLPRGIDKKWDDTLKQNYVEYTQNGATYKMWVEDERSILEKVGLANKYELAGVAFWSKDRETEDIWKKINEKLNQ